MEYNEDVILTVNKLYENFLFHKGETYKFHIEVLHIPFEHIINTKKILNSKFAIDMLEVSIQLNLSKIFKGWLIFIVNYICIKNSFPLEEVNRYIYMNQYLLF